jgi:hypothetical protein
MTDPSNPFVQTRGKQDPQQLEVLLLLALLYDFTS